MKAGRTQRVFAWGFGVVAAWLTGCGGGSDVEVPAPAASARGLASACPAGLPGGPLVPDGTTASTCADATATPLTLTYASGEGHQLDLYRPATGSGPFPTVVWIHGGGWLGGSRLDVNQARRLVCRGYAVASIDYRLSDVAVFPAQLHDVKAAIRFLRANAAAHGLDPSRFAAFGSSAGGHLAALAGTSRGVAGLEDPLQGNAGVSSAVQAVVDWYGPTDFARMDSQLLARGCGPGSARHSQPDSPESQLVGCTVGDASCQGAVALASPVTHVGAGDPPMLVLHGDQDCTVPGEQSLLLASAMETAGRCVVQRDVVGAGHGGAGWVSTPVQDATAGFLDAVLKPAVAPSTPEAVCSRFQVAGNPAASTGATWTYDSVDQGVHYVLKGIVFKPATGTGPFPAVVISHGKGGTARGYSANVARTMVGWGLVAMGTTYTHAADAAGTLPEGDEGASEENVLRAHKARDLLSCVGNVDFTRVAAHGHSMGGFVTGQLLGTHPADFRAASHTAGGVSAGPNSTRPDAAGNITTPYQLHHGDADTVVPLSQDQTLKSILAANGTPNALYVYAGYTHDQIPFDTTMLSRVRTWYRQHGVLP
ncbi:prolyl oligopeptidase family serine peptidase [Corallococcus carmarthensis]|uniref:Alpha/beta hydrolase n=1 Tax=Corallococcus carmarthensis TaxID=2316728 RepID=A0A3A8KF82_9BACT|nr:prolyl oligopeptidase family serine peptidase [Corallococcus carmarthensis]RKH05809.1 alpha/beta hydrolase [Corallococcus carmarthensis]